MNLKNLAIIAFSLFTLASCSSEKEGEPVVAKDLPKTDLISELKIINSSLKVRYEPLRRASIVGEGEGADLLEERWTRIALADAVGALGGWKIGFPSGAIGGPHGAVIGGSICALVLGAVSSITAYNGYCETTDPNSSNNLSTTIKSLEKSGELLNPEFMYKVCLLSESNASRAIINNKIPNIAVKDTLFNTSEKIAIKHNEIVNVIAEGIKIDEVNAIKISPDDIRFKAINTEAFKKAYSEHISELIKNPLQNPIDGIDNAKTAQILKLYKDAIALCPDKAQDISYIINLYIEEIYKSNELSEQDRTEIYNAIAVGAYSSVLWEKEAKLSISQK